MAESPDVDELTVDLYTGPPEEFVARRADGARRLRQAGLVDDAAAFAKLAKPSLSAWLVDRLVTDRSDVVDEVVAAGDALRLAHTGGVGLKEIHAAHRQRQAVIRSAVDIAAGLAGRAVSENHRLEIGATLEAASADRSAADEVRRGRLVRPLEAPTGFDTLGGLTVIQGGRRGRRQAARGAEPMAGEPATGDAGGDAGDDGSARVAMLDAEAQAAADEAAGARAAASELTQRLAELEVMRADVHVELQRVESELTGARRAARQAERQAADAERRASRLATRAARANHPTNDRGNR